MSENEAICVQSLTKKYRLYNNVHDRLKEVLNPFGRKYHQEFYALNNVDFEIIKGETVGLLGKNGSGKSTLLKILTGVTAPTSGNVRVNGKVSALLELGAGFNPMLTGIENIYFNGTLMGYSKEEIDSKLDDILAFADIGEFVKQPVKSYSSGMFVRLAFSISINVNPDILIIDEALAVGDELFQRKCYAKIRKLAESGATILFVTHSHQIVSQMCTKAILLDGGSVKKIGSPKTVISLYNKLMYGSVESADESNMFDDEISLDKSVEEMIGYQDYSDDSIGIYDKYLPQYVSQSAFVFNSNEVIIDDIKITNCSGKLVNVLTTNSYYILSYRVTFGNFIDNAYFGMCFKTATGIAIGWYLPPFDDYLRDIQMHDAYEVKWKFKCSLLSGSYFADVSVYGHGEEGFTFYSRITDSLAFKVESDSKYGFKGIVNFEQQPEIIRL